MKKMDWKTLIVFGTVWAGMASSNLSCSALQISNQEDNCYKVSFTNLCWKKKFLNTNVDLWKKNLYRCKNETCDQQCRGIPTLRPSGNETKCQCQFYTHPQRECTLDFLSSFLNTNHPSNINEHAWLVTKCSPKWPNDVIRSRCQAQYNDLLTRIPVAGRLGLTYKNIYCAHCNSDSHFDMWPVYAECQSRIPDEVLSGDIETIYDYAMVFCDVRLASTTDIIAFAKRVKLQYSSAYGDVITDRFVKFPKSLQRCIPGLGEINKLDFEGRSLLTSISTDFTSMFDCEDNVDINTDFDINSVQVFMDDEHLVNWNLPVGFDVSKLIPKQQHITKPRMKRWTPPSFSMLLQFNQPDSTVVYTEEKSGATTVTTASSSCDAGEVYDPVYSFCRPVICTSDQVFTGFSCEDAFTDKDQNNNVGRSMTPVTGTLTVVIDVPWTVIPSNFNTSRDVDDLSKCVTEAFMGHSLSQSLTLDNVTVTHFPVHHRHHPENGDERNDEDIAISLSFVLADSEQLVLTDEEIIEIVHNASHWITYEKLLCKTDYMSVVIVDSYLSHYVPICDDIEREMIYFDDEYKIVDKDGQIMLYIPETYRYYTKTDYQFLDWIILVNENGTERRYIDSSRVLVCEEEAMNISSCFMYVPLNQTEYKILPTGDIYLYDRNVTVPKNESAVIDDTLAICIDDYLLTDVNQNATENHATQSTEYQVWMNIVIWTNFCLSILSLISLLITFVTYVLFEELRTISGYCVMNLVAAQFLSMTLFFVSGAGISNNACKGIAATLHFLFLSAFFWNNVISFDVWRTFGQGMKTALLRMVSSRKNSVAGFRAAARRKTIYKYMVYAWGIPCAIVCVAVVLELLADSVDVGYEYDPSAQICWISNGTANIVAFGVPVFIILIANAVFFCLTIISIRKFERMSFSTSKKQRRKIPSVSDEVDAAPAQQSPTPQLNGHDNAAAELSLECRDMIGSLAHDECETNRTPDVSVRNHGRRNTQTELSARRASTRRARANVFTYLKMSVLMGFSWMIGFFAAFTKLMTLWVIFDISISLQGIFILLAFVWKKRIRERYRNLIMSCFHKRKFEDMD